MVIQSLNAIPRKRSVHCASAPVIVSVVVTHALRLMTGNS